MFIKWAFLSSFPPYLALYDIWPSKTRIIDLKWSFRTWNLKITEKKLKLTTFHHYWKFWKNRFLLDYYVFLSSDWFILFCTVHSNSWICSQFNRVPIRNQIDSRVNEWVSGSGRERERERDYLFNEEKRTSSARGRGRERERLINSKE